MAGCAVCDNERVNPSCQGAFQQRGIAKVHWECWSQCNLGCGFCYRTLGEPLNTNDAKTLIDAIASSGATGIVFAGGDPTLRRDLAELIKYAVNAGLLVEVQTNAHFMPSATVDVLTGPDVSLIGLSLDGASANTHDHLREARGNFDRVLSFLGACHEAGKPVILRTVVNKQNLAEVAAIGRLISPYHNVVRWSLLEFTAIGEGYENQARYSTTAEEYRRAMEDAANSYEGPAKMDPYRGDLKVGTYALVTPSGDLYGTANASDGRYPIVGNMLTDHLVQLAGALPFVTSHHRDRYGEGLAPELET